MDLMEVLNILIMMILMGVLCGIGWVGQWGRTNKIGRYIVNGLIGVTGFLALSLAGILFVLKDGTASAFQLQVFALILGLIGLSAVVSLVIPARKLLAKTIFPGLDASVPAHTWALFVFLSALIVTSIIITLLYSPELFAEGLQSMPLEMAAAINAVSFVLFAFVAGGIWIYKPFRGVADDLGLTRISWKMALSMVGAALVLAIAIQGLEGWLRQFVSPEMWENIQKVVEAMKTTGGVQETLTMAIVVGICAGVGEEILFRGLLQPIFGILPTAILFALIHMHYGPTVLLLELFVVGAVLGYLRQRYNTTAAIIVHGAFDFFAISSSLLHQ